MHYHTVLVESVLGPVRAFIYNLGLLEHLKSRMPRAPGFIVV